MISFTKLIAVPIAALALASQTVSAAPVEQRDVYVPPVTYPHAGTVWYSGQKHNVTWDTSDPPKQITNRYGEIYLGWQGNLITPLILAKGFDILDGRVEIEVPWVMDRSDYSVVLFGDSGNFSPEFTIHSD